MPETYLSVTKSRKMNIEEISNKGYTHLKIIEPLIITSCISDLTHYVQGLLNHGNLHITLSIPDDSFLSSSSLAKLIVCGDMARLAGGTFTVIAPNDQILQVIHLFDLGNVMHTASSIDDLMPVSAVVQETRV